MRWFQVNFEKLNIYTVIPRIRTKKKTNYTFFFKNAIGKLKGNNKKCSKKKEKEERGNEGIRIREK